MRPRGFNNPGLPVPTKLDEKIYTAYLKRRSFINPPKSQLIGLGSHVLLAACGEKERAFEDDDGGMFTKAVLSALRKSDFDLATLTYSNLIKKVGNLGSEYVLSPLCDTNNSHNREQTTRSMRRSK